MEPIRHIRIDSVGLAGLITDLPAAERGFQHLTRADNIRIQDGQLATIPEPVTDLTLAKTPVFAHPFFLSDDSGGHVVVYDDGAIDYIDAGRDAIDITPVVPMAASPYWYAAQVNDVFVITNGIDAPHQITQLGIGSNDDLEPMPNWPGNYTCRILEDYKGFLVAAGIEVGGVARRSLVKWAHPLAPGDSEFFWDFTDPTLLAGENELSEAGREIAGLQLLRDNLIIYFDQSVWRASYVGGEFVFTFTRVFSDDGAIGPFAFIDFDSKALVVGNRDIYMHDGFSKQSVSDRKITRSFYRSANVDRGIYVAYYPYRREAFVFFRSAPALAEYDRALIYNIDANAFTSTELPGPAGEGSVIAAYMAPTFAGDDTSWQEADDAHIPGGVWSWQAETDRTWASILKIDDSLAFYLVGAADQELVRIDENVRAAHQPGRVYIEVERAGLADAFGTVGDKIKYLSRMFPRATSSDGAGKLEFSIGTSLSPSAPVNWGQWITYDLEADYAVDLRGAARYLGLRVRLPAQETRNVQLSSIDFELMFPDGGRQ